MPSLETMPASLDSIEAAAKTDESICLNTESVHLGDVSIPETLVGVDDFIEKQRLELREKLKAARCPHVVN